MNRSKRNPVVAGNWKMNKVRAGTKMLIRDMAPLVSNARCNIAVCVPFTDLDTAVAAARGTNIIVGAQNCHWEESGAFTGEISADMLTEIGVSICIVGHSERRQYFGETDETVNKRLKAVLAAGMACIVCVGETLDERSLDKTLTVLRRQVTAALQGVPEQDLRRIVIAYEPVWAIGTGKNATPEEAGESCRFIRVLLQELYNDAVAEATRIVYGGSMNGKNAGELLAQPDIDGGLIGGASLKASDFAAIVAAASK